ncbi:AEC family transporter [Calidifontibacillus erzurumensis]|uniref:AEC family transporter n=1 Tax=Calidifontibacillus erzurumensis TaxID=2741433 RepID=A0A8J8GFF9_9BACI|nr:AEC family transporter [Calidifontibacillus erzurumensis]NSL52499.1 AEC family transporter [Calidifontibacillus erzurumensis]
MDVFFLIVTKVIFPIFLLIGTGVLLHRKFELDLNTLSKLSTYFLLPAVCFVNIYEGNLSWKLIGQLIVYLLCFTSLLILLGFVIGKLCRFDQKISASYRNSLVLINSGNFGLPISELLFHANPIGISIQVIISIYQNILTFTYGLFNSVSSERKGLRPLLEIMKLPIIYALILAILLRAFHIEIPDIIWDPVESVSNAFLAIALITLGAQVAHLKLNRLSLELLMSIVGRLILSPVISLLLILSLGIQGVAAQALLIASSFPTSRNSALLALEYNNNPEYAAQVVLLTTICSSITVAVVVYIAKIIF